MVDARLGGVRLAWRPAGRLQARMAHTKGWGASAAIKSDVSGAQVLLCPQGGKFSGNEVRQIDTFLNKARSALRSNE